MDYIRKVMHGFDHDKKVEVLDEFQWVGWNDGGIMILSDIVKEEIGKKCIENNNIVWKQSVTRTGVEKMRDVSIIFNILKQIEKQTKLKDIPFYSLSFVTDAIFSELKEMYKLHINANKVRILNDFLARFPYMSYKTCTCDRTIQVFIDVVMLDAKHKFWPGFYALYLFDQYTSK